MAVINGDSGNNTLVGTGDPDTINGLGGNDTLEGGLGADTLNGGDGDDIFIVNRWPNFADYAAGEAYNGGAGIDTLSLFSGGSFGGSPAIDLSTANLSGVERFINNGDLPYQQGSTTMTAAQVDAFSYIYVGSLVINTAGAIDLTGASGFIYGLTLSNAGNSVTGWPFEIRFVTGGAGDDVITNVAGANIRGNGGNDTIIAGSYYNTIVYGGDGNDKLTAGSSGAYLEGNSGDDTLTGSLVNDKLYGGDGKDVLFGGDGVTTTNILDGGSDSDTMTGGSGSDIFYVNDLGDQVFDPGGSNDQVWTSVNFTLQAGIAIEYLWGTGTGLALTGNELDNRIYGGSGNDIMSGGGGSDTLSGGGGINAMSGGAGNDYYYVYNGADQVSEFVGYGTDHIYAAVNYTLQDGSEIEYLRANAGTTGLRLTGNELVNRLLGGAGSDVLDGGGGADMLYGGFGGDHYYVDSAGDAVYELAGEGFDTVFASVSHVLRAGSEIDYLRANAGATGLTLTGNEFVNRIYGAAGNDMIDGKAGADLLYGAAGNDTFYVDNASDAVFEAVGEGDDTIYANLNYMLRAGSEIETLRVVPGTGGVRFTGNEFANRLLGGDGNDILDGRAGADRMVGGFAGNDTYYVDNAGDRAIDVAGGGTDTVYAVVDFTLEGGSEIEYLRANAGATGLRLTGNEFANQVFGAAGADRLDGGAGNDRLDGMSGVDTFVFRSGFGQDRVVHFEAGPTSDDILAIDDALFANYAAVIANAAQVGADTVITYDAANKFTLEGVLKSALNPGDFGFF